MGVGAGGGIGVGVAIGVGVGVGATVAKGLGVGLGRAWADDMAASDAIAIRAIPPRRSGAVLIVSGGMFILPLNRIGENFGQTVFFNYLPISEGFLPGHYEISWGSFRTFFPDRLVIP